MQYALVLLLDTQGWEVCAYVITKRLLLLVAGWSRFSFRSLGGSTLRSWLWRLSKQWRSQLLRLMSELSSTRMLLSYSALVYTELKVILSKHYSVFVQMWLHLIFIKVNVYLDFLHLISIILICIPCELNFKSCIYLFILLTTARCIAFTYYICKYYVSFLLFE